MSAKFKLPPLNRHALRLVVALLAGLAGWQLGPWALNAFQPPPPPRSLPVLSLPDLQGRMQSLHQWQGRILVVNLWAAWCPPCRAEMPGFSRLQDKYADKNVQFVGIALDQPEEIAEFSRKTPVHYPLLIGDRNTATLFKELGNRSGSLPFTAIFTADGQLRHIHRGYWQEDDLDDILGDLAVMKTK